MDGLIRMEWTVSIISGISGIVVGIIIGVNTLDYWGKRQFREKTENNKKKSNMISKLIDPRNEERTPVYHTKAEVRAPMLDDAGVVTDDQITFDAGVIDISQHGISIISQHFLKTGLNIKIRSQSGSGETSFPFRAAEVRNIKITSRGLQIGLQFLEPLDTL
jgi:hypothetical protein